jgi:hypothetical protein
MEKIAKVGFNSQALCSQLHLNPTGKESAAYIYMYATHLFALVLLVDSLFHCQSSRISTGSAWANWRDAEISSATS